MGVRKNAKHLTTSEIEDFVRACVLMKDDLVNPLAAPDDRYSRWDEFVAIHRMIQNADAPGANNVNFGHGGNGAFSFLSWHRYFLLQFELQLQVYVPGVMLPYWDWTDPSSIMTDTFLGPDGGAGNIVTSGYFAEDAPGTGSNPVGDPGWWPPGLVGWRLHAAMGPTWEGPLQRNLGGLSGLPTADQVRQVLDQLTYSNFQNALESGSGIVPPHSMHNGLHVWISGHMGNVTASPFDPLFYLHHCNIDRLWAMWQMDGHADEYPDMGGDAEHHRNDIMYPWVGATPGYSSNLDFSPIVMPDFSALGVQRNVDTLDHRALGYTYDSLPIVGVSLDRTGSMNQLTPDPMTVAAPDVTKWEAATQGVSAFFQDCESAYQSNEAYVYTGVETFHSSSGTNHFNEIFAPASGLVKNGGAHSQVTFDAAIAAVSPGGGTPLADALTNVDANLVKGPFANLPADEQRYLAILTDGKRTSGSTIASIPDGSLGDTAVFAMGFGTGVDVDYPTLEQLVDKGTTLATQQVFHGENAGTIDKFYTESLAAAIGYVPSVDPVLELFAGEHAHVDFYATSADDSFFITAQGMDFTDPHWSYMLVGPDGKVLYGSSHNVKDQCCKRRPRISFIKKNGRLSMFVQRDSADYNCWVGHWQLMVSYKARDMSHMVMMPIGALLAPVSAGPVRGKRYHRPRNKKGQRPAARLSSDVNNHALDLLPPMTSANRNDACNVVVNVYARTRLKVNLISELVNNQSFQIQTQALTGAATTMKVYGRLFSPTADLIEIFSKLDKSKTKGTSLRGSTSVKFDTSKILAKLEAKDENLFKYHDQIIRFDIAKDGTAISKVESITGRGIHHFGVIVEGEYFPDGNMDKPGEHFVRLLNITTAVVDCQR